MTYLETLHSEHKARLARFQAAADAHIRDKSVDRESEKVISELRAQVELWKGKYEHLKGKYQQKIETETRPEPAQEPGEKKLRPTIFAIKQVVAAAYGLDVAILDSPQRRLIAVRARHIAMYLAYEHTAHSMPAIGNRFGGRDHTTVLSGYRKMAHARTRDKRLDMEIRELEHELGCI